MGGASVLASRNHLQPTARRESRPTSSKTATRSRRPFPMRCAKSSALTASRSSARIFLLADADDERRAAPRADNRVRKILADDREAVSADDFAQRIGNGLRERVAVLELVGRDSRRAVGWR